MIGHCNLTHVRFKSKQIIVVIEYYLDTFLNYVSRLERGRAGGHNGCFCAILEKCDNLSLLFVSISAKNLQYP